MIAAHDRTVLRDLASRVVAIAEKPEMEQRRRAWMRHNALHVDRPLIAVFPEGCWPELLGEGDLQCADPLLRQWELMLRRRIIQHELIGDDQPIDTCFDVRWRVDISDYGVEIPRVWGDNRGSYVWDPPLKNLEKDLAKLRPRTFSVDREGSAHDLELAHDVFGDLLHIRRRGRYWWTVGLTQTVAYMLGIEPMMLAMFDQPQALHDLLAFLRDDMAALMDFIERERLVAPMNENDYVGSGGLGYTDELPGDYANNLRDVWGFAESQESVGVSPAMFHDFILPYQLPLLERFGLNCYGCCEGLEHRIDFVMQHVPRLRRVSVSPKADQKVLAEKLAGRCVFSRKADPVPVCVGFNEQAIRNDIRKTLDLAGDQPLEIILKDTHTLQNQPERLTQWVCIARDEIERKCGS